MSRTKRSVPHDGIRNRPERRDYHDRYLHEFIWSAEERFERDYTRFAKQGRDGVAVSAVYSPVKRGRDGICRYYCDGFCGINLKRYQKRAMAKYRRRASKVRLDQTLYTMGDEL